MPKTQAGIICRVSGKYRSYADKDRKVSLYIKNPVISLSENPFRGESGFAAP
jgi:hypothetical protein